MQGQQYMYIVTDLHYLGKARIESVHEDGTAIVRLAKQRRALVSKWTDPYDPRWLPPKGLLERFLDWLCRNYE